MPQSTKSVPSRPVMPFDPLPKPKQAFAVTAPTRVMGSSLPWPEFSARHGNRAPNYLREFHNAARQGSAQLPRGGGIRGQLWCTGQPLGILKCWVPLGVVEPGVAEPSCWHGRARIFQSTSLTPLSLRSCETQNPVRASKDHCFQRPLLGLRVPITQVAIIPTVFTLVVLFPSWPSITSRL